MSRFRTFFIPVSLFFLAFFLRLAFISKGPFHYDALELAIKAQKTFETLHLHYLHIPGSPLTVTLAALNIALFRLFAINDPVFVVNFMAVYVSSLCVVLMYLAVKELLNDLTAVFSALFLLVLPPFLSVSVYGKDHALSIFFILLSLYYILKYLKEGKIGFVILAGIALGLSAAVRLIDSLLITVVFLIFLLMESSGRGKIWNTKYCRVKSCIYFILPILALLLIFYLSFFRQGAWQEMIICSRTPECTKYLGLSSSSLSLAVQYVFLSLSFWGTIFSLFGFYILFLRKRRIFLFFIIWFVVLFFYFGNTSSFSPRFLIVALLPLIITASYFFSELAQTSKLIKALSFLIFFITLLGLLFGFLPTIEFRHRNNLQSDFANWIAGKTEETAVIMAMDENIFVDYYAKRKILWRPVTCDEKILEEFSHNILDKYLTDNIPLYITTSGLAYDFCGKFSNLLNRNYRIEALGCKTNEDWHHSCLKIFLFKDCLFRISLKSR